MQTSVVPLKLCIGGQDVWINRKPSSSHFCRPLSLKYKRETKEVSQEEEMILREQMDSLSHHDISLSLGNEGTALVSFRYNVEMTMLDGKAVNALTNTLSTQSCNVCGAKPSEMNNLKVIRKKVPNKNLSL